MQGGGRCRHMGQAAGEVTGMLCTKCPFRATPQQQRLAPMSVTHVGYGSLGINPLIPEGTKGGLGCMRRFSPPYSSGI